MQPVESLQRRATKYILNDYTLDYRSRLIRLHLLLLSMVLELNDICFFIKSLKLISPNNPFNILDYTSFSHSHTRSRSFNKKLVQLIVKNHGDKQFYFIRLPYLWNSLPPIDLSLSFTTIKKKLLDIFWDSFLTLITTAHTTTHILAQDASPGCFSYYLANKPDPQVV